MEPRISLITLGVSDLERSLRFYRDGLVWPVSGASVPGVVAFFHTGGTALALWSRTRLAADANLSDTGSGFGGIALAHNVRTREEVDALLALAERWLSAQEAGCSDRPMRRIGAATPATVPTRTATRGRSRGTRDFPWMRTLM